MNHCGNEDLVQRLEWLRRNNRALEQEQGQLCQVKHRVEHEIEHNLKFYQHHCYVTLEDLKRYEVIKGLQGAVRSPFSAADKSVTQDRPAPHDEVLTFPNPL